MFTTENTKNAKKMTFKKFTNQTTRKLEKAVGIKWYYFGYRIDKFKIKLRDFVVKKL